MLIFVILLTPQVYNAEFPPPQPLQSSSCFCPPEQPCPFPALPVAAAICPPIPSPCSPQHCPPPTCPPPQLVFCPSPCPSPPPPCPPPIPCPATPPCPISCPPPPPCPLPIPCYSSCPPAPLSFHPCSPITSTIQNDKGESISSSSYKGGPILDGIFKGYKDTHNNRPYSDGYPADNDGEIAGRLRTSDFSTFRESGTGSGAYLHSTMSPVKVPHPRIKVNKVTSKPEGLFSRSQQPEKFSADMISENALQNVLLQTNEHLPRHTKSIVEGGHAAGIQTITRKAINFLIKDDCQLNGNKCDSDDIIAPPENDCCTNCSTPCRFQRLRTFLASNQLHEVDPICNNEFLRQIITDHATDENISTAKIRVQRAARRHLGGQFGVICGTGDFAYAIQTVDFCLHRTKSIICYAFRPFTYDKNIGFSSSPWSSLQRNQNGFEQALQYDDIWSHTEKIIA